MKDSTYRHSTKMNYTLLAAMGPNLYTLAYVQSQGIAEIFKNSVYGDNSIYDNVRVIEGKARIEDYKILNGAILHV